MIEIFGSKRPRMGTFRELTNLKRNITIWIFINNRHIVAGIMAIRKVISKFRCYSVSFIDNARISHLVAFWRLKVDLSWNTQDFYKYSMKFKSRMAHCEHPPTAK